MKSEYDSHLNKEIRDILDSAPIGIQIIQDDKYVFVNQKALQYTGYSREEMIGNCYKRFLKNIHPDDRDFIASQIETKQSGGNIEYINYQFRGITKTGEIRWFDKYSTSIQFRGKPADLVFIMDITSKKKNAEMLNYYKMAIEGSDDFIVAINKNYEYLFVSESFLDYHQLEREEVVGHTASEVLGDKLFQNTVKPYVDKCLTGKSVSYEMKNEFPNLGKRNFLVNYYPIMDENSEISFISAIIRDITELKETKEKLKETEKEFEHLIENSPFSIMLVDQEGIILDINSRFTEVFGYKKEEIINKNIFHSSILHSYREELLQERFSKHLKGEKLEAIPLTVSNKNGEYVHIDPRASVISFGGEKIVQISMKDITEKKQAERALKESEKKYRLITENINDLIAILNKNFEYEYINEKITHRVMGYAKEDVIGKNALDLVHPEDRGVAKEALKNGFRDGEGEADIRVKHKDGHWVWLEIKGKTFNDIDGKLKALIVSRDITKEKKAKEKLKESERKYRQMAELLPDIIYEADINSNLTYVNSVAYETLGYTPDDIEKGLNIYDLVHEDYEQKAREVREKLLQGKNMEPTEMVLVKKDGSKFYGRFNAKVTYSEGEPTGFIGTITDISDLIETQHELEQSKKQYKTAYDRSDFFKNLLAHDVANVLNNINLSLGLVEMKAKTGDNHDEIKDSVDMIHSQVEKGKELISDIRKIDKVKSSDLERSKTNVERVLKDIVNSSSMLNQSDVSIAIESDINKPQVMAGPFLKDAFENVLINGIQHNQSKNRFVKVSISEVDIDNEEYIQIEFEDNGIGIPDEDKKLIFEGKQTQHRDSKGMGLGLSLVKSIVSAYNGRISVKKRIKDDYSKGTMFTLSFPSKTNNS